MLDGLDRWLYLALNAGPDAPAILVVVALVLAGYAILLVPLHLVLVWAGGDRMMRFIALTSLLALALALGAGQAVWLVLDAPRPSALGIGQTMLDHDATPSFPCMHGLAFFTYAIVLAVFGRGELARVVAGLGLLVAWARIYLGAHFPLDMAGAAIIAVVAALTAVWVMTRVGQRVLASIEHVSGAIGGVFVRPLRRS